MRQRNLKKNLIKGLQWSIWGYIIAQIFVILYCYNVDPTVFIYGNSYEPVTVKTWFGEKTIYPKYQTYPIIYEQLNKFAWIGFAILFIVVVPNSMKKEYPKLKKINEWISKHLEDDKGE